MLRWVNQIESIAIEFAPVFETDDKKEPAKAKPGFPQSLALISLEVNSFKVTLKDHARKNWMTLSPNKYLLLH